MAAIWPPAITAPLASVTLPVKVERNSCADSRHTLTTNNVKVRIIRLPPKNHGHEDNNIYGGCQTYSQMLIVRELCAFHMVVKNAIVGMPAAAPPCAANPGRV